ncbi:Spo0B domain-containing protein [Paenibacillus daejeonensis]|uniref:Spo0B domain-containing protein n=1 Tax=Paenibacillus daejeonensis TaxID=135193 RepID=UPI000375A1E2|nr:Spo0B domain-containing protein [Paenibacillus daejeonensis]
MNRLRWLKFGAAASLVVPAVVIWTADSKIALLLCMIWVVAAAALWIAVERKEHAERLDQTVQHMQEASIRTLNHHRHDWMNELQVLYGYIRLQKPDKTVQCVERIKDRMMMESRIAKLGEPALVLFLQSFRTASQSLQLDVVLEEEVDWTLLGSDSAPLAEVLRELVDAYRLGIQPGHGDAPRLMLEFAQYEGVVEVAMQLTGELQNVSHLEQNVKAMLADSKFRLVTLAPQMDRMVLQAETC